MLVISITDCPAALRGDLTKWLFEINVGVYVGQVSARVRDELWNRILENCKVGRVTMVYQTNNEQRIAFRVHNSDWKPIDFDGLTLMLRPTDNFQNRAPALRPGFSKAAQHQVMKRIKAAEARKNAAQSDGVTVVEIPHSDEVLISENRNEVDNGKPYTTDLDSTDNITIDIRENLQSKACVDFRVQPSGANLSEHIHGTHLPHSGHEENVQSINRQKKKVIDINNPQPINDTNIISQDKIHSGYEDNGQSINRQKKKVIEINKKQIIKDSNVVSQEQEHSVEHPEVIRVSESIKKDSSSTIEHLSSEKSMHLKSSVLPDTPQIRKPETKRPSKSSNVPIQISTQSDTVRIRRKRDKSTQIEQQPNLKANQKADIRRYVVIDIETTGLDENDNEIIELGAIRVENGMMTERFQCLVQPNNKIPEFIVKLTGITDEMVENQGIPLEEALEKFISFISNDMLVGHNVEFDIKFIQAALKEVDMSKMCNASLCTLNMAKQRLPNVNKHSLKFLVQYFNIKSSGEHRSLFDCESVFYLYETMLKM